MEDEERQTSPQSQLHPSDWDTLMTGAMEVGSEEDHDDARMTCVDVYSSLDEIMTSYYKEGVPIFAMEVSGVMFTIYNLAGLEFIESSDIPQTSHGIGIRGLAVPRADYLPGMYREYCNFTVSHEDMSVAFGYGGMHSYPAYYIDGNVYAPVGTSITEYDLTPVITTLPLGMSFNESILPDGKDVYICYCPLEVTDTSVIAICAFTNGF